MKNMTDKKIKKRKLIGVVISDKMDKTVTVRAERIRTHAKYLKQYKRFKKFKAHDEKNEFKPGDLVLIELSRPLSHQKRWRVVKKLK
jgi:small subunit ribosomal protein S17